MRVIPSTSAAARTHDNLLFVRWRDGFEELYDCDDPRMYKGRANTPREQQNADMLRNRQLAIRTATGDQYQALETG